MKKIASPFLPHSAPPEAWAAGAGVLSGALLLGALGFQYIGGLEPCVLCVLQRWPHVFAMLAGLWAWVRRDRLDALAAVAVGAVMLAVGVVLAGIHTGVEIGLWASPFGCGLPDWSDPALIARMQASAPPDCDVVAWSFLGHSMAAWNGLFSALLLGIWLGSGYRLLMAPAPDPFAPGEGETETVLGELMDEIDRAEP